MVLFGVLLTCIPGCGRLNSIRVVCAKDVLPNFPFGVELGFFFFFFFYFFFFFLNFFFFFFNLKKFWVFFFEVWFVFFFFFFFFFLSFVFVPTSAHFGCCNVEMD